MTGAALASQLSTASMSSRGDVDAVLEAQQVLEQDLQRKGQPGDLLGGQRGQAADVVGFAADLERERALKLSVMNPPA